MYFVSVTYYVVLDISSSERNLDSASIEFCSVSYRAYRRYNLKALQAQEDYYLFQMNNAKWCEVKMPATII